MYACSFLNTKAAALSKQNKTKTKSIKDEKKTHLVSKQSNALLPYICVCYFCGKNTHNNKHTNGHLNMSKWVPCSEKDKGCCLAQQNTARWVPRYSSHCFWQYTINTCPLSALCLVINNSAATHLAWLQRHQWYRIYRTDNHSVKFRTITVTLTLTLTMTQQSTLLARFMTKYCQTKSGCKRIGSTEDMVEFFRIFYMSPHWDLDLDSI